MTCARCAAGLDHCHGALIDHHDGVPECTDSRCADPDVARHPLSVSCAEVRCACSLRLAS